MSDSIQQSLENTRISLLSIIKFCRQNLTVPNELTPANNTINDALCLLYDAANLIKSLTTRLAIALRPPIASDIAQKFLLELASQVIPTLTAGAQIINDLPYGVILRREVINSIDRVLSALERLLQDAGHEGRLVSIGIVWAACDQVISLKTCGGLTGVVERIIKENGDMVADAADELKQLVNQKDTEGAGVQGDKEGSIEDEDEEDKQQKFWDSIGQDNRANNPELLQIVKRVLKSMKLISILFFAAQRRRLGIDSEGRITKDVKRLEAIAGIAQQLSGLADDQGMACYDGNIQEATSLEENLISVGIQFAGLLCRGEEDEDKYTPWFTSCEKALRDILS